MPRLIAYDRVIDSAIMLPGTMPAADDAVLDWQIGMARQDDAPPFVAGCHWIDGQLIWSINPAEQHAAAQQRLTVRTIGEPDQRSVRENVIANGLPALSWIAGDLVLHAAAVVLPDSHAAIAIMAPSGGGKSTLLNELMQAGASLLADDTLVLRWEHGRWIGSGLPGGWYMRNAGSIEREFVEAPAARRRQRAPVGAIMALTVADAAQGQLIERRRGMAGLSALLNNRHRPQVPRAMGSEAMHLPTLAAIAAQVPIVDLTRQRGRIRLTDAELAAMARLTMKER